MSHRTLLFLGRDVSKCAKKLIEQTEAQINQRGQLELRDGTWANMKLMQNNSSNTRKEKPIMQSWAK